MVAAICFMENFNRQQTKMLQNDKHLRNKISITDVQNQTLLFYGREMEDIKLQS
jgi:hypothetical protein